MSATALPQTPVTYNYACQMVTDFKKQTKKQEQFKHQGIFCIFLLFCLSGISKGCFQIIKRKSKRTRWLRPDDLDIHYTLERLVFFTPSQAIPQHNRPRCQKDPNEIRLRTGWWPVAVTTTLSVCGEMCVCMFVCGQTCASQHYCMYAVHECVQAATLMVINERGNPQSRSVSDRHISRPPEPDEQTVPLHQSGQTNTNTLTHAGNTNKATKLLSTS